MSNAVRIAVIGVLCVALLIALRLATRPRGPVELDSGRRIVMGTFSRVVVIARNEAKARACIAAAFAEQDRIESLMSYYHADSELSRINREAADGPVQVNDTTFEVLQQARRFSELSEGAFDVTVGPLMDLWRAAASTDRPPTQTEMADALAKVGWRKVVLDVNTSSVRFSTKGMKIDLGGIAKGYAVDKSVEAMKREGALGGMVDLGGNIRCFGGMSRGRQYWYIPVQDPNIAPDDLQPGSPPVILQVKEGSISTSGHYRRFVAVAGQKQSHIVDPRTGYDNESLASVTVIAPDAISADALSTAVSVLGQEKGLELIEKLPDVEAILIPAGENAQPILTPGAGRYLR